MRASLNLITSISAAIILLTTATSASPVQARAPATVYTYMTATTMPSSQITTASDITCPDTTITDKADCPSGCTAAPLAGLVGAATDTWSCMSIPPETSWTSVQATSTCGSGSTVKTYTRWGGQTQLGCHATY